MSKAMAAIALRRGILFCESVFGTSWIRALIQQIIPNRRNAILQPPRFFNCFLNGLKLFDVGVHGVLFEIQLLGQ
jgi:hypothetical protein